VLNHLLRDPRHIEVFPEKSDEHEFLFGVELWADLELLLRIIGVNQNFHAILILRYPLILIVHLLIDEWWGRG
jgi:hypothetical protein